MAYYVTLLDHYCFTKGLQNSIGGSVLTTAHQQIPSRILNFKSSLDTLRNFFPNFEFFDKLVPRIFGNVSYIHIHPQNTGKSDLHSLRCVFIGYFPAKKAISFTNRRPRISLFQLMLHMMEVSPVLVVFTFKGRSYIQGESLNGEGTLDLLLCKFSIPCRVESLSESLPESPFLKSPEYFVLSFIIKKSSFLSPSHISQESRIIISRELVYVHTIYVWFFLLLYIIFF